MTDQPSFPARVRGTSNSNLASPSPEVRVAGAAYGGDPVRATEKLLTRTGMSIDDNEASAAAPLAWSKHFGADIERVNPRGGAIALCHPLVGVQCPPSDIDAPRLDEIGGRWNLQTMCEAGGMAHTTIIERLY